MERKQQCMSGLCTFVSTIIHTFLLYLVTVCVGHADYFWDSVCVGNTDYSWDSVCEK